MREIDWASKLTSRKFWAAIASFVSMLIIFFGGAESTATQVTALIMAGASVVAYIIGEGLIDAANKDVNVTTSGYWDVEEEKPPEDGETENAGGETIGDAGEDDMK